MPEGKQVETKPESKPPESSKQISISLEAKLKRVYNSAMLNHGKNGYNPSIWLRDNYQKLADALAKGIVTKELEAAIMALPDEPDTRIYTTK